MTEFVNTSVATKSAMHGRPASLAMLAAVALSSTVSNYIAQNDFLKLCSVDQNVLSATADLDLKQFHCDSASTEPKALNHEEAGQALARLLAKEGFNPSRVGRTAEQSILFQFLGKTRACIDLYPTGELIVLVRKTNRDEIHELEYADSDRAIKLLQDAGVNS
jgi:hypothetical protein